MNYYYSFREICRNLTIASIATLMSAPLLADDVAPLKLPHLLQSGLYYPERAIQRHQQGRVLVEFRISEEGTISDLRFLAQEPADFAKGSSLANDLKRFRFDVPPNWNASANANHLYRLSLVFLLSPCGVGANCPVAPYEADDAITITHESSVSR
jgi:TonB family protein